ncbi:hypothetical protein BHM03_00052800, partial [Ensete ventricosum]
YERREGKHGKRRRMEAKGEERSKRREPLKRRHGSTAFFMAVDYLFLLVFFCFLCYFLHKIWPGSKP